MATVVTSLSKSWLTCTLLNSVPCLFLLHLLLNLFFLLLLWLIIIKSSNLSSSRGGLMSVAWCRCPPP
jgi:hypothetical protein